MQTDISALQILPEAEHEADEWPCTISGTDADDEE
jgi:hypothetical protein